MKLYNTLTRTIEEVKPLDGATVRIYSCGPTVYDHAHIGNLSAYIFADTLRRAAQLAGHHVMHAMNYTDVDDKTIRRSREAYADLKPDQALKQLANTHIGVFLDDMQAIGNDVEILRTKRATDTDVIAGMQQLIGKLHQQGFAYIADDGAYFSIEAYRKSGKTYGQLLELTAENTSSQRIQNDEYDKDNVHDFALWKKQKPGEPAWAFTLDGHDLRGRPGWHIECSVMSRQLLGQPFDIHTGGVDLIFPHHENEIAQSTAGEANPILAKTFAHNEHILVDGKKMSKSAHNFYTLDDIVKKGYNPLAFRLLVLQAHYRSQAHFSWENLEAAQNRLKHWQAVAVLRHQTHRPGDGPSQEVIDRLAEAINNDLDTPKVLQIIDEVLSHIESRPAEHIHPRGLEHLLTFVDELLGLQLMDQPDISADQKRLVADREAARGAKDWAKSDKLRGQLAGQGIGLRDTPSSAIWYRL